MKKRAERGINDGGGNGKRKRWTVHFYLFTRGIRRRLARYRSFTISTDKELVREVYVDINLFTREKKKKTRARSFYPSSLELITSSCDPLSNRLRASAGSKRCIIEETINASISSAQAIVSHDIITHARGKPEILPTIYIYTHSRIIIFFPLSFSQFSRSTWTWLTSVYNFSYLATRFPILTKNSLSFVLLRFTLFHFEYYTAHFYVNGTTARHRLNESKNALSLSNSVYISG